MRHLSTTSARRSFFKVLLSTADAQAAMMTLKPGQSTSDEPVNEHPRCEQWVLVLGGTGKAIAGKRRAALKPNSLLLIEKGEPHQITATGKSPLVTLNFYAPPAYTKKGDLKLLARVPTLAAALTPARR
ncbi:MAG TPA: cupin domain-containing protein [Tepidisphaeraceae bacterium]|nr:cupin domain-containing protein [Tepidisphaeraceae bacterium]